MWPEEPGDPKPGSLGWDGAGAGLPGGRSVARAGAGAQLLNAMGRGDLQVLRKRLGCKRVMPCVPSDS